MKTMKKSLLLLPLFLFLWLALCFSQVSKQPPEEEEIKNVTDPYTWDFGKVRKGDVLKHIFVLRNKTGKTLNIKQVGTSCGCTASEVKKKNLLPGTSTEIQVTFETEKYLGPVQQFIYVTTDDLDNPILRFIIKAEIIKE